MLGCNGLKAHSSLTSLGTGNLIKNKIIRLVKFTVYVFLYRLVKITLHIFLISLVYHAVHTYVCFCSSWCITMCPWSGWYITLYMLLIRLVYPSVSLFRLVYHSVSLFRLVYHSVSLFRLVYHSCVLVPGWWTRTTRSRWTWSGKPLSTPSAPWRATGRGTHRGLNLWFTITAYGTIYIPSPVFYNWNKNSWDSNY